MSWDIQQVTRGHNIVPHPTPPFTQTYTRSFKNACSSTIQLVLTEQGTDRWTNGWTKPPFELRVRIQKLLKLFLFNYYRITMVTIQNTNA